MLSKEDKIKRFNTIIGESVTTMTLLQTKFTDDTPSDTLKWEILEDGIDISYSLMNSLMTNEEIIDDDILIDPYDDSIHALAMEDSIAAVCTKLLGDESAKKLFNAMATVELLLRNICEARRKDKDEQLRDVE